MSILHSILKMARTNEAGEIEFPEIWDTCECVTASVVSVHRKSMKINRKGFSPIIESDQLHEFRIITKSFDDLAEEVKENPTENAFISAFSLYLPEDEREARAFYSGGVDDRVYGYIGAGLHFITYKITKDWGLDWSGNWGDIDFGKIIDSLRVEGYPVGIPQAHIIHQSEIKQ